ncbi:MAG: TOBE-like domain-containing protein [Isosphaeraceae bacterium]
MDAIDDESPLPVPIPGPGTPVEGSPPTSVYVRPHDFEVTRVRNGRPAWTARVHRMTPLGGLVKLDMTLLDGTSLNVQLTREHCLALGLTGGEIVYVTPKDWKIFQESQAFVENYVI